MFYLQGRQDLVLKLLSRQFYGITVAVEEQFLPLSMSQFSMFQLESLGEALLDFEQMSDLLLWLQSNG